jgi:hypothetical protein
MDRELTFKERILLKSHYIICDRCDRYHDQLEIMRQAMQLHKKEDTAFSGSASLSPEARSRIKAAVLHEASHQT